MADYLNVYDLNRQKSAVLQNAFDITETQELNKIYTLDFEIPADDPKVQYLQPFHYVRFGDTGQLYRIIKTELTEDDTPILSVNCEHVIAVLCDDLMFGAYQYGGGTVKTADVIQWLLSKQKTANWVLADCDFERRFEYNWEQENILNALYSIPKEFTKAYKWVFNTAAYPWQLSLKTIDATIHPEFYIRAKRNLLSSGTGQDFAEICTRIYPLGYGEGVNQLSIKEINNGLPYLQSPAGIIAQYGIKEKVLVDRRYENAESLKEYAQTMLEGLQTPSMSRSFDVVDLYPLTSQDIDDAEVGKICKMTGDDTVAYVTKTVRVLDQAGNLTINLSTKATDVASTIADLADRIRIESVYAQGATQLYQHSKDTNATPEKGMIMSLYFPAEMRQINKVLLRLKLNKFRSYSQATNGGGASTITSQSGGSSTVTSQSGGSSTVTSQAGGQATVTSASGGQSGTTSTSDSGSGISLSGIVANTTDLSWTKRASLYTDNAEPALVCNQEGGHQHYISANTDSATPSVDNLTHNHATNLYTQTDGRHSHGIEGSEHNHTIPRTNLQHNHGISISVNNDYGKSGFSHSHNFSVSDHTHSITIPSHTHNVSIPAHTHNVSIPAHTHNVSLPAHTHTISAGIFESGNPTAFDIYVGNTKKATVNATTYDGDIVTWLLNSNNQVPRNTWIDIEIRPNDLAYCQCSVFIQGFVQSRGGGNY